MPQEKHKTNQNPSQFVYGLGIDAGGTYTDAVILNISTGKILSCSKASTTPYDPSIGIIKALSKLPENELKKVDFVSLATTFATNAIVEGKGVNAGLILIGYDKTHPALSKLSPVLFLEGGHDYWGKEVAPLDLASNKDEIISFANNLDAIAISGFFSTRNPDHELQVADLINTRCDLPVVCGHRLTSRLDAPKRATTAWWNARLIPLISRLIKGARSALSDFSITSPLMVVKGDGTIMSAAEAMKRPVDTLLSGPAASIMGAKHIGGVNNGLIIDMGGTTTDMATLCNGRVEIDPEGAQVGNWKTHVEAAKIKTCGLGGDSIIWFSGETDKGLRIGPERVEPLCVMAERFPEIITNFEKFVSSKNAMTATLYHPCTIYTANHKLSHRFHEIPRVLVDKPFFAFNLNRESDNGIDQGQLLQLERKGLLVRSSLTLTDLCVSSGQYEFGNKMASQLGLKLFARKMGFSEDELHQLLEELIAQKLCLQTVTHLSGKDSSSISNLIHQWFPIKNNDNSNGQYIQLDLKLSYPVVGIGAPAKAWFPKSFKHIQAQCIIPENFMVGTAIGAAVGVVGFTLEAEIKPKPPNGFILYSPAGMTEYNNIESAIEQGRKELETLAVQRMKENNIKHPLLKFHIDEIKVPVPKGELHLKTVLKISANGRLDNELQGISSNSLQSPKNRIEHKKPVESVKLKSPVYTNNASHVIIACRVMKPEIDRFVNNAAHIEVRYLDASLHETPNKMPELIQEQINEVSNYASHIVLGYGLCSNGIVGIKAPAQGLIIPRVHDCIALLLGSRAAYDKLFLKRPGTYYLTPGWIQERRDPIGYMEDDYVPKLGKEMAEWGIKEEFKNYTHIMLINTDSVDMDPLRNVAIKNADFLEKEFEEVIGKPDYLRNIVLGPWDEDDFIYLKPGEIMQQNIII
ncbi:MAG: DUF1638 domain-containing protein [Desulfobacterales bacterium]|nr:DUF1638 domain-containing protein [Desulfobacterales bacterium]